MKLTTQKDAISYIRKLKPRHLIRASLKDRKSAPFIYEVGKDIPGNTIKMTESLFEKLRNSGKIKHLRTVNNKTYSYMEYIYASPKRRKVN